MDVIVPIVIVVVISVLVSLLGLWVVRRVAPAGRFAQHTDVAGYVYAVIGVLYAVILAQVVIAAWEDYSNARVVAADEANAVLNLARLAQGWPEADRDRIEESLTAYAHHVIASEWPEMASGDYDPAAHTAYAHQLWQAVNEAASGAEAADTPRFTAAFDQLDALDDARRGRVLLAGNDLPQTMRLTLILGAVVTVGFAYLFAVESGVVHGLMVASLATLVALLLLLQFELETPFAGASSIEPTAMEFVVAEIASGLGQDQAAP
jgi:hypothetical protein